MVKNILNFFLFLTFLFVLPSQVLAEEAEVVVDDSQYTAVEAGKEFEVTVRLKTDEPILEAKLYLLFDPSLMQPLTIDREKSGLSNWLENAYFVNKGKGIVKLWASVMEPGVSGDINIAKLKLKKLKAGDGNFGIDSSSYVLNSKNKNILANSGIVNMIPFLGNVQFSITFIAIVIIAVFGTFIAFRKIRHTGY